MNTKRGFRELKNRFERFERLRKTLQEQSTTASRLSKQAIFSLQRGEAKRANEQLAEAESWLKKAQTSVKTEPRLANDGQWRAALEEFTEACFVEKAVSGKELFPPQSITDDPDILIGGLSDLVGELVRLAVRSATEGDSKRVDALHALAEETVEFITSLDLTGSLRSKGDQARQHLRRLEDVRYDISRRA